MKITVTVTGQGAISTARVQYPSIKAAYMATVKTLLDRGYPLPCSLNAIYKRLSNRKRSTVIPVTRGTAFTIRKV